MINEYIKKKIILKNGKIILIYEVSSIEEISELKSFYNAVEISSDIFFKKYLLDNGMILSTINDLRGHLYQNLEDIQDEETSLNSSLEMFEVERFFLDDEFQMVRYEQINNDLRNDLLKNKLRRLEYEGYSSILLESGQVINVVDQSPSLLFDKEEDFASFIEYKDNLFNHPFTLLNPYKDRFIEKIEEVIGELAEALDISISELNRQISSLNNQAGAGLSTSRAWLALDCVQ